MPALVRRAFTLIELLVVIAIVAILAAILFPVFAQARAKAKQTQCASNMKQLSTAMLLYLNDTNDRFPTGATADQTNWGKDYWMFHVAPYLQKVNNIQQGPGNVFSCPENKARQRLSQDYADVFELPADFPETAWGLVKRRGESFYYYFAGYAINEHLTDFETRLESPILYHWDVPADSFMFLEANKSEIEGDELYRFDGNDREIKGLFFRHSGGSNYAYLDGHVKWRKAVYRGQLSTDRNGNWVFPPGSDGRGDQNDCGPWTTISDDDARCPRG